MRYQAALRPEERDFTPASDPAGRLLRIAQRLENALPSHSAIDRFLIQLSHPLPSEQSKIENYNAILLLWPGKAFAVGSMNVLAKFTAMHTSPTPVAISFNLPS